jgi:hypothetical protein
MAYTPHVRTGPNPFPFEFVGKYCGSYFHEGNAAEQCWNAATPHSVAAYTDKRHVGRKGSEVNAKRGGIDAEG